MLLGRSFRKRGGGFSQTFGSGRPGPVKGNRSLSSRRSFCLFKGRHRQKQRLRIDGDKPEITSVITVRGICTGIEGKDKPWVCGGFFRPSSITCLKAASNPGHTGRRDLVRVQAKIHGMVRSDSILPLGFLFDGLLPMLVRSVPELRSSLNTGKLLPFN